MSELEFAAKVITNLEKENTALKRQLTLYRWAMVVIAVGLAFIMYGAKIIEG